MRRSVIRMRGVGFILWHSRHEMYHVLLGLVWAWFLRETWGEFRWYWVILSVFAALLPDMEHVIYWLGQGKMDKYSRNVKMLLRTRQWRNAWLYVEKNHKHQTNLSYHNIYMVVLLFIVGIISFYFDWKARTIFFGATLSHYVFDIFDDYVTLGYLNANWKRWGKPKEETKAAVSKS